ncbi:uncharacterized protein LOC129572181 [Sitodiplosis mosellana]|uniref:uncharacterized protein LOC129572181 n=1 Tax=Sitodiplosis mosellana TaxID=263140 RepID=UPI0024449F73|nr:uncharacterized protein LOC129572181 [Sitodiplosis mosellana]
MGNCKILNCKTKKGEQTLFCVPHDPATRAKWIQQIRRHQDFDDVLISYPVCALHFNPTEIMKNRKRNTLKKGAVPTIFPSADGILIVMNYEEQLAESINMDLHEEPLLDIQPVLNPTQNLDGSGYNAQATSSLVIDPVVKAKKKNVLGHKTAILFY